MRFIGNIDAKVDDKCRVFLPAAFRRELQSASVDALVMRMDVFQPCITLYPMPVWNGQMDAMRLRLNRWNSAHQQLFRQFVSDAEVLGIDGSGRILIPKRYMRMAAIEQGVRFIGMGDTIEMWSSENAGRQQMDASEFAEALTELMRGAHPNYDAEGFMV